VKTVDPATVDPGKPESAPVFGVAEHVVDATALSHHGSASAVTTLPRGPSRGRDAQDARRYASCTTSNSRRVAPDATGLARAPACASLAGPLAHAWYASSLSHRVYTK
jgi:hypothetical protein